MNGDIPIRIDGLQVQNAYRSVDGYGCDVIVINFRNGQTLTVRPKSYTDGHKHGLIAIMDDRVG